MKLNITKEEALSLLQQTASLQAPEFALLIYANDRVAFTQALYRARKGDPILEAIQIRQIGEGIALLNPNFNESSADAYLNEEADIASEGDYDDP